MKMNQSDIRGFLIGNLLGDGNLHFGSFRTQQINEDLVRFKYKIFKEYFGFANPKIVLYPANVKNGVSRKDSWSLYVSPTPYLKDMEKEFYQPYKIVTQKMLEDLTILGLAIWYADDGTTILVGYNPNTGSARSRRVQFCTDSFSYEEVKLIAQYLEKKYGEIKIIKRSKDAYRVQINIKGSQQFLEDISSFFLNYFPSLLYKLDMGYRKSSLLNRTYVTENYHNLFLTISSHPSFVDRIAIKEVMI